MANYLVTGATGYLGSSVCNRLHQAGHQLSIIKRTHSDLFRLEGAHQHRFFNIDSCGMESIFRDTAYDGILHFATNYGRRHTPDSEILQANLLMPLRLLEEGIRHNIPFFLNTDTMLDKGVSHYTLSKRQFREWMQEYQHQTHTINVALEHFYGPLDDVSKFTSYIFRSLMTNAPSIPLTEGTQKRDFIYIEDVVEAFLTITRHANALSSGYSSFEVGSGLSIPVREFVEKARDHSGNTTSHLAFGVLPMRENEPMDIRPNLDNLRQFGWAPRWTLDEGLKATFEIERSQTCES